MKDRIVAYLQTIYANVRQPTATRQNYSKNAHPFRPKQNHIVVLINNYLKHARLPFSFQTIQVNQNKRIGDHFGIGDK